VGNRGPIWQVGLDGTPLSCAAQHFRQAEGLK
jgi:hypothetical protein